jgi:hypothetical protein
MLPLKYHPNNVEKLCTYYRVSVIEHNRPTVLRDICAIGAVLSLQTEPLVKSHATVREIVIPC